MISDIAIVNAIVADLKSKDIVFTDDKPLGWIRTRDKSANGTRRCPLAAYLDIDSMAALADDRVPVAVRAAIIRAADNGYNCDPDVRAALLTLVTA